MATKDISDAQVCEAYREWALTPRQWPYEFLMQWTNQPFKVCYRAMERAYDRGLIEYGVSLRAGWLTPEGKALLEKEAKANA